jgi:hypothetical protein
MFDDRARQTKQARRALFTAFRLWTVCPSRMCGRHKACRGDADRCLRERWQPLAPPELKATLQKIFANQAGGMTLHEAIAAARTSMAAYRRPDEAAPAEKPKPFVPADAGIQALPNDRAAEKRDFRFDGNEQVLHPRSPRHRGPRVRQL